MFFFVCCNFEFPPVHEVNAIQIFVDMTLQMLVTLNKLLCLFYMYKMCGCILSLSDWVCWSPAYLLLFGFSLLVFVLFFICLIKARSGSVCKYFSKLFIVSGSFFCCCCLRLPVNDGGSGAGWLVVVRFTALLQFSAAFTNKLLLFLLIISWVFCSIFYRIFPQMSVRLFGCLSVYLSVTLRVWVSMLKFINISCLYTFHFSIPPPLLQC